MREMMQQLQRSLIRPVNVFEDEQHRIVGCKSLENAEDQLEWSFLRSIGSVFDGIRCPLELRKQWSENRTQWSEHFRDCLAFAFGDSESQRVHERRIWD